MPNSPNVLKIGVIDMTYNLPENNLKLQSVLHSLDRMAEENDLAIRYDVLDLHTNRIAPYLNYHLYIASDGEGDPTKGNGELWEQRFFSFIDCVWNHNQNYADTPKFLFFTGYAFQLMCRYFQVGRIEERETLPSSFAPVSKTWAAKKDYCFGQISDQFFVEDKSKWGVVDPDLHLLAFLEAQITAVRHLGKNGERREEVESIRIGEYIMGMQAKPEVLIKQKSSLGGAAKPQRIDLLAKFLKEATFQLRGQSSLVA